MRQTLWLLATIVGLSLCLPVSARRVRRDESSAQLAECQPTQLQDGQLSLHIAAVFILLVSSFLGVTLPASVKHVERIVERRRGNVSVLRKRVNDAIFGFQHFGSGVILSTAFVHLLNDAFESFNSPCIGPLAYEPTCPAIAMGAIWIMFILDFLGLRPLRRKALPTRRNGGGTNDGQMQPIGCCTSGAILPPAPRNKGDVESNRQVLPSSEGDPPADNVSLASSTDTAVMAKEAAKYQLAKFEVITLESGIVFHSMIIGVTLGSSSGDGWIGFLIAIAIHQFCEGVALASRIVILNNASTLVKTAMYMAFSVVTSVGIAIGIGVRTMYNDNDAQTILAIGVLNSISAGILLYSALVQILAGDFMHNPGMLWASTPRALSAIALVTLGCIIMSLLGNWA